MNFNKSIIFIISIFTLFSISNCAKTTTETTVWVTLTSKGKLTTAPSAFKQTFTITHTSATADIKSGGIGLGSISGEVGGIRSYEQTTIKSNGGGHANANYGDSLYSGLIGGGIMLIGIIL